MAQVKKACNGDLSKVKSCIKLTGFVNSTNDFSEQPKVINGASDLIASIFGDDGMHTRAAALVCIPSSPKIEAIKSDAPLITFGCSEKSFVEFTKPVSLIHDFTFDKSPLHAFLTCATMLRAHLLAAWYPESTSKSFPTFPLIS